MVFEILTFEYCALLVNLFVTLDKAIHRLRKKWLIIELKSASYFLETEKCTHNQIYIQFIKLRQCSNEWTIP